MTEELDENLKDILNHADWYADGLNPSGKEDRDNAVEKIKEAFVEAGYITPENAKKVQEMVSQMANLANDVAQLPTIQYIKPNRAMTKAYRLMTGQEWYHEFEILAMSSGYYSNDLPMMKLARKAAGIES